MSASDRDEIAGYLEPVAQLLSQLVRRGKVHRVKDGPRQRLQVEVDPPRFRGDKPRVQDGVEHFLPYGVHVVPRAPDSSGAAECLCLLVGDDQDHPLVVLVADVRGRPTDWGPGDTGLYDYRGQYVRLREGKIVVDGAPDVELGDGATKGVARNGDAVQADATTDSAFWSWFTAVGALPGGPGPPPATLSSQVTGGSSKIKAVD